MIISKEERQRRKSTAKDSEYEFLHLLEGHGFAVWYLKSAGDMLAHRGKENFGVDVKIVSIQKTNGKSYCRVYFRKDGTMKFLKNCAAFGFKPIFALRMDGYWYISTMVPKFTNVKKHGTTNTFESLKPISFHKFINALDIT